MVWKLYKFAWYFIFSTMGGAHSNDITAIIEIERLIVHVALQSAGCIACRPTEECPTKLGGLTDYADEYFHCHISFEAALIS